MRPADALAFPRMTFQLSAEPEPEKAGCNFKGHFSDTFKRHFSGMALPCPSVPGAPYPRCRRARQGMSDMCPVTATSKTPVNAALLRSGAALRRFGHSHRESPQNALQGVAKRERPTVAYSRPPPIQFFAVGQTRLQSYLAKSATLCYNERCLKCYTFCRLKLNW